MPLPLLCLLFTIVMIRIIEVAGGSRFWSRDASAEAVRLLVHTTTFALLYALTWRPLTSLGLAVVAVGGLAVANVIKKRVVFEPIVFSDLCLLGQIVRHPELYLIDRPGVPLAAVTLSVGALATAIWLEPPSGHWILGYGLLAAIWLGLFTAKSVIRARFEMLLLDEREGWGSICLGLLTSLALQFLCWLAGKPVFSPALMAPLPEAPTPCDIVVIQLESFVDLPVGSSTQSPAWAQLTSRSRLYGKLGVQARGANTMRTEHSVLSGVPNAALGFDRFDPYLRRSPSRYGMVETLRKRGWNTTFLHPNDLGFFRRKTALPLLGFDKLVGKEAFHPDHLVGPYVGDCAVVNRVIVELENPGSCKLVFAVTMENHGPWKPGRLPGVEPGMASYLTHQKNMFEAVETLFDFAIKSPRRTVIVIYGDHAPALADLPAHLDPYQTDYLIFDNHCLSTPHPTPMAAENLLQAAISSIQHASSV